VAGAKTDDASELRRIARKLRVDVVRMIHRAGSGHPGGSLSVIDILVALFLAEMNCRPEEPDWPGRDRFVLSKGHGCSALYAIFRVIPNFGVFVPADAVVRSARETAGIVTAEEHLVIGGLGSAVAEVVTKEAPTRVERVGVQDVFGESGPPEALLERYGLSAETICSAARRIVGR